jgi:hypothetical protein
MRGCQRRPCWHHVAGSCLDPVSVVPVNETTKVQGVGGGGFGLATG